MHQSKNDHINEESVLEDTKKALATLGITVVRSKSETTDTSDCVWLNTDGVPVLVEEVKCRFKVRKCDFRTYKVDKAKVDEGIQLAKKLGAEYLLVVWWGEKTVGDDVAWGRFITEVEAQEFEIDRSWGRNAERDDHDPAYCIPTTSFDIEIPMSRERLQSKNGR